MPKRPKQLCPKCGVEAYFDRRYLGPKSKLFLTSGFYVAGECIVRECSCCGYEYDEDVIVP